MRCQYVDSHTANLDVLALCVLVMHTAVCGYTFVTFV